MNPRLRFSDMILPQKAQNCKKNTIGFGVARDFSKTKLRERNFY